MKKPVAFIGWWVKQVNPGGLRLKIAGLHKQRTPLGFQEAKHLLLYCVPFVFYQSAP